MVGTQMIEQDGTDCVEVPIVPLHYVKLNIANEVFCYRRAGKRSRIPVKMGFVGLGTL